MPPDFDLLATSFQWAKDPHWLALAAPLVLADHGRADLAPASTVQTEHANTGQLLHSHALGQLFFLTRGLCALEQAAARWSVPPGLMGWIPPGVPHRALDHGPVEGWSLYLAPKHCATLPPRACGLECSSLAPLLLQRLATDTPGAANSAGLIADAREAPPPAALSGARRLRDMAPAQRRLFHVLLDELRLARPATHHLPLPNDSRFAPMLRVLLDTPADPRPMEDWAAMAAMSARSFSRIFAREAGMPFAAWRRMLRLMRGHELLAEGMSVQEAAWAVGYQNVSAFIAGFRRLYGQTPAAGHSRRPR
ncbi:MAG: helix-turn-helix transcriptional regulator [Desulfovibrio sp.]|nr:helix-turn-helix transcriptional regulator [Desulfovibrio sp.]MCA1985189.1 helix-turn-helix transcriptional regulator [Desulfovibrio sp.]